MMDRSNVRSLFEAAGRRQDDVDAQHWRASVTARLFGGEPDPVHVDRYTVLDRLGAGGAGTVFAAWDPKLERRIALKILHAAGDGDAHQALRREAKLLAQLNHPHVVSVYDVSTHQGQPVLAMEYVDGPTIGQWAKGRSPKAIAAAFAQAARGLAAAHAAGIVHGDFKPSNALVGTPEATSTDLGRVRVSDFGIARFTDDRVTPVFGTPLYTAPELFEGGHPDTRSDAFAFFAALFECLYDRSAFVGTTRSEVVDAIQRGVRVPTPTGVAPRWLEDLVHRGLDRNPNARPSDFSRIATALERRGSSSRRWGAVLGVIATTTTVVPLLLGSEASADDCRDAVADLQANWTPQVQSKLAARWHDSSRPSAADRWDRVRRGLDDYVHEFVEASEQVCDAGLDDEARLQGELCLRWRQQDFEALTAELATLGQASIDDASTSLQALRSPAGCVPLADTPIRSETAGPVVRHSVQGLVSRARALRGLGRDDEARKHLGQALSLAQSANATRLQAEVLLELGRERAVRVGITEDSPTEMTLEAARQAATSAGDRQLAARASLELADAFLRSARFEQAEAWLVRAEDEMSSFRDPVDRGRVELLRGVLLSVTGQEEAALPHTRTALALLEDQPAGAPWLGRALNSFGELRFERGDYEEAQELYERGLAVWLDALGPHHPHVADIRGNLGEALLLRGRFDDAAEQFEAALTIRIGIHGEGSFLDAHTRAHLADALRLAGRTDEAAEQYRTTLAAAARLREEARRDLQGRMAFLDLDMGLDQVEPWAHNGLALLALQRGDYEAALEHARAAPQPDFHQSRHPDLAARRDVLGLALLAHGEVDAAIEHLEGVEAEVTEAFGHDCIKSAYVPAALGRAYAQRGDAEAAAEALARAATIRSNDRVQSIAKQ